MLERLTTLLTGLGTPAQLQSVYEAITVLSENGFQQCEQIIEDEIALCANEPAKLIGNLTDLRLIPLFREFLEGMGIVLISELPLASMTEIFEATIRIENFEDQDLIYSLATSDDDAIEIYLGILSVVSTKTEEHFAPMVESVSEHLIKRIAEVIGDFAEPNAVDPNDYARAKGRVLRYIHILKADYPALYAEHVKLDQLRLGCSAVTLLEDLRDHLEDLKSDAACILITLFVLSSNVEDSQVAASVHREIGATFTDITKAMGVSKEAVRLLAKVGYE